MIKAGLTNKKRIYPLKIVYVEYLSNHFVTVKLCEAELMKGKENIMVSFIL